VRQARAGRPDTEWAHKTPAHVLVSVAEELRELAHSVRRMGNPYRTDPEAILTQKEDCADRLLSLAAALER